jgi:glycine cleavage system H protein
MADKIYDIPPDCSYTRSDEWVRVDGDAVRIGVTDYAQSELSDVVFVELPDVGSQIEADEPFGVVESVKAVSDLLAPLSGEVTEVNEGLDETPEWVNEEPYGRGWLIVVIPEDLDVIDDLLSPEAYRAYVEERTGS